MPYLKLIAVGILAIAMAGCGSKRSMPDPEPTDTTYGSDSSSGADTGGFGSEGLGEGEAVDYDPSGGELANIIYFDFDSSEVRPEYTDVVARHAMQLANNPALRMRLEGHADERGSREYNIGLGERRSQTVRRMLLLQGATPEQISTVSFGEERPVAMGSDEEAYAQNRRVEIKYSN